MQGKLNGLAVRVPLTNSSITDCVFEVEKATTAEEVNKLLKVRGALAWAQQGVQKAAEWANGDSALG